MSKTIKQSVRGILARLPYILTIIALGLTASTATFASSAPDSLYGNYTGTGKCTPDSPKLCTDTGPMDTIYLQRLDKKETPMERRAREGFGLKKNDTRVSIRILQDHGHSCTFEQDMYWVGNHLTFFPKAPYPEKICKMQIWLNGDTLTIKDPGNACSVDNCANDIPTILTGQHYKKGPDPLIAAYKKSATPPPATIFGTYYGTGKCATDERKSIDCVVKTKSTDTLIISPSKMADAHVAINSAHTRLAGDAMWLGNHLTYHKAQADQHKKPHLVQFWFKDGTVVTHDVWGNSGGASIYSGYFKKSLVQNKHGTQQ